jgi:hypothetical protein
MVFRILALAVSVSVFLNGCSDSDPKSFTEEQASAVRKACVACSASKAEMAWMTAIIEEAKDNAAKDGFIYSIKHGGRVIFIHQMFVLSCLGCVLYDCKGERIELNEVDHENVMSKMTEANLIYIGTRP